jgi:oxygen-independent coproporphyrinogen-3 oxidase
VNAYVHIPFCASICTYCDFASFAGREGSIPEYADALCAEIEASDLDTPLRTVYFGGGTPSLFSPSQFTSVLEALRQKAGFEKVIEISSEANPDSAGPENLEGYRRVGINRLSLGAQAAQDPLLTALGRRHDALKVKQAVQAARKSGFDNINLDVMFGLPGQTIGMLGETLDRFLSLNPEHVSLYALQVEAGTPMAHLVDQGLRVPDEDEQADQYEMAQAFLASNGLVQYEVSNFAKPRFECRHNMAIWRGEDYQGFGVSAVGTVGLERRTNPENLEDYLAQARSGFVLPDVESLSDETRLREKVLLGLRTCEGAQRGFLRTAGVDPQALDSLIREGWLLENEGRVLPSPKAYFVLHGVLRRLLG